MMFLQGYIVLIVDFLVHVTIIPFYYMTETCANQSLMADYNKDCFIYSLWGKYLFFGNMDDNLSNPPHNPVY